MAPCTEPFPLGEYGDATYGDGVSPCGTTAEAGYGDGVDPCDPIIGDPCLVATIIRMTDTIWVGHRTESFGGSVVQATSFPECRSFIEASIGSDLVVTQDVGPGRPDIYYLKVRAPCL
jgi:hypothetical protein